VVSVVARERELSLAEEFLYSARESLTVLVLEGEPGIGKTTVWRESVRLADSHGFRTLACRPARAEAKLSFSALTDLFGTLADETFDALPPARRQALEVALLRADAGESVVDRRAVAAAVTTALRELASERPLLIAVDDVQWLDPTSAATLAFALRRMGPERVGLLVARRTSEVPPFDLDDLVEPERLIKMTVGPLNLAGLHHLLKERLGDAVPRSTLVRIHDASGGNPLFAIEVGRVLAETGTPPAGEPLPIPSDVRELVRRRVGRLTADTREVLLAAASLARPREDIIRAVVGRPVVTDLEPAEREQVAALERAEVVFAHPLFAGAIYRTATSRERRDMHRRLAQVLDDSEERGRHLALAADGPDEETAAIVHSAAANAAARGAPIAAAELTQLSLTLTEPRSALEPVRTLDAARYLHVAGETERARELLEAAVSERAWPPMLQAKGLDVLADFMSFTDPPRAVAAFGEDILATAESDEERAVGHLAISYASMQFDVAHAVEHADAALAVFEGRLGERVDAEQLASALMVRVRAGAVLGEGLDRDLLDRAIALEAGFPPDFMPTERPSAVAGFWYRWVDDLASSRQLLGELLERAISGGHETTRAVALCHLALNECLAGDLGTAHEHAEMAMSIAEDLDVPQLWVLAGHALALTQANLGAADEARDTCEKLRPIATESGGGTIDIEATLGLVELSVGDIAAANRNLLAALEVYDRVGFGEPGQFRFHADAGEAAVAAGNLETAEAIADLLERHGARTGHHWSLATGARVRALLAGAHGDVDEALSACERALYHHDLLPMPLERARTLLVKGMLERRARRRGRAKETFEQARAVFAHSGARLWADRAAAELDRLGLRRSSGDELTEAEQRVAELAAKGLTNREVAATLHLSPKTVGANLSRVYRKLGIRSRAELGARMSERVQA
jgi:DNA-binding CsgD family transcriptional regulator